MKNKENINQNIDNNEKLGDKVLKSILFTVAYYNTLDYRPTSFFVWKHLIGIGCSSQSLMNILEGLERLKQDNRIFSENGFWFIGKKSVGEVMELNKQQIQKNKISTQKIKEAKRWAKTLQWIPYVRSVFLTGTLAMKRGGSDSDWDVLIVLKKNRIWLGRLFLTGWLQLIGKRRHGGKVQNRFCLNQFITENSLKFQENNEFAANEILMTQSLFSEDRRCLNIFMEKNIDWIKKIKPNVNFYKQFKEKPENFFSLRIKNGLENILEILKIGGWLNKFFKQIMIKKIIRNPKTYTEEADIRYSDFFLVFLPYPQRNKIRQKTLELIDLSQNHLL